MKVYVASSWRNQKVGEVVAALRANGHEVYDFREDDPEGAAFNWRDIDPNWQTWSAEEFRKKIFHPRAAEGFNRDFSALMYADAVVLVMPCGRSAHLELGCAVGAQKITAILLSDGEPELCYRMVGKLCLDLQELLQYLTDEEKQFAKLFKLEPSPVSKKPTFQEVPRKSS